MICHSWWLSRFSSEKCPFKHYP